MRRFVALIVVLLALVAAPNAMAHSREAYGGYPFITDTITVRNNSLSSHDNTAINRVAASTNINVVWSYSTIKLAKGVNVYFQSNLTATTGWAGYAVPDVIGIWDRTHYEYQTRSCKIVVQSGMPALKTQFVIAHEFVHCLGHTDHVTSTTALMRRGTAGWQTYYTLRDWEKKRINYLYTLNDH